MIKKAPPTKKEYQKNYNGFKIRNNGSDRHTVNVAIGETQKIWWGSVDEIKKFIEDNGGDTSQQVPIVPIYNTDGTIRKCE
jgi:hypothetical protein